MVDGVEASVSERWEDKLTGARVNKAHCDVRFSSGQLGKVNDVTNRERVKRLSWRYMAKREVGSEVSEDLRESLIALSYSLPDAGISSIDITKSGNFVSEAVNKDENDKVRANLISISYAESPDTKDSPVSPKKTKG